MTTTQTTFTQVVKILRLTGNCYAVTAYDFAGRLIRHRYYACGSPELRRTMAITQARMWAERFYLQFDENYDLHEDMRGVPACDCPEAIEFPLSVAEGE